MVQYVRVVRECDDLPSGFRTHGRGKRGGEKSGSKVDVDEVDTSVLNLRTHQEDGYNTSVGARMEIA